MKNIIRLCLTASLFLGDLVPGHAQSHAKFIMYDQPDIVLQNARSVDVVKGIVLEGYSVQLSKGKITGIAKRSK